MFGMHICKSRIVIHIRFMYMYFDVMVMYMIDDSCLA